MQNDKRNKMRIIILWWLWMWEEQSRYEQEVFLYRNTEKTQQNKQATTNKSVSSGIVSKSFFKKNQQNNCSRKWNDNLQLFILFEPRKFTNTVYLAFPVGTPWSVCCLANFFLQNVLKYILRKHASTEGSSAVIIDVVPPRDSHVVLSQISVFGLLRDLLHTSHSCGILIIYCCLSINAIIGSKCTHSF